MNIRLKINNTPAVTTFKNNYKNKNIC